jgi:STE24 endopeptidase
MNAYALIVLAALLAEYAVHLFADALNLRTLGDGVPEEFRDVYDPAAYRRSQEYTRTKTLFGIFSSTVSLASVLAFWFAGGFPAVDQLVRRVGWGEIPTGLLFIGALVLLRSVLSLPLSVYSTFVIETRFGFNRTTVRTFVADLLKGVVLGILLGAPLLALILWFFMTAGSAAWLWCWGAVSLFTLVLQFVAPTWIMPLFNTFVPIEEGTLKAAILAYAERVRFPLQGVYVMDGSKRSSKSNAFFTGFGKYKRIALFDTLIKKHSVPELVAVVAHEIGHYKRKHILKGMAAGFLQTGVMFFLLSVVLTRQGLYDAFFMETMSVYAGLVLFGILFTPAEFFLSLGMNVLSRKHEFEADRFSAETTGAPAEMVSALRHLSVDNLSHLTPHPFYVFLHYSHPPVLERIRALGTRAA